MGTTGADPDRRAQAHAAATSARDDPRIAVTCPFCGLACDDLVVDTRAGAVRVVENGCERSRRLFQASMPRMPGGCWVGGVPAPFDAAVREAGAILRRAERPAFGGLATDVAGVRALLDLAERRGAIVDHMNGRAMLRNTLSFQRNGWVTTTFAEVRNRADLIVVAGTDVVSRFPRFFERIAFGDAMFVRDAERAVVFVGEPAVPDAVAAAGGGAGEHIGCRNEALAAVFGALAGIVGGTVTGEGSIAGVPLATLRLLAERMRAARYGVLVWVAADLEFPHAELAVDAMCDCVRALNVATRFAALPLAGNDADTTAHQVCVWQTGYPPRLSFAGGSIDYDPYRHGIDSALVSGDADALLWVASLDAERAAPPTGVPTILLARPGSSGAPAPAVRIDVGVPGVDHAGHFFRGDAVVAVRLRRLVASPLPPVADVVRRIAAEIEG
jgi:formylmethanofuran dehydrogenase subunit B